MDIESSIALKSGLKLLNVIAIILLTGCHYYKYTEANSTKFGELEQLIDSPNYVIIHHMGPPLNMVDIELDHKAAALNGRLIPVALDHSIHRDSKYKPGSPIYYKKRISTIDEPATAYIVNEVHFYINEVWLKKNEYVSLPIQDFSKIEVYDRHRRTTTSFIISFVSIGLVGFNLIMFIEFGITMLSLLIMPI